MPPVQNRWGKKQDYSPTDVEMESFGTITRGFLLVNEYNGSQANVLIPVGKQPLSHIERSSAESEWYLEENW